MKYQQLALAATLTLACFQPERGSFAYAQRHEYERQSYLEHLLTKGHLPPTTQIFYDPGYHKARAFLRDLGATEEHIQNILGEPKGGFFTPFSIANMGSHLSWPVFVSEQVFTEQYYKTEEEVTCVLFYHEGTHAEQMYTGIRIGNERLDSVLIRSMRRETLALVAELNAYQTELAAMNDGRCTVRAERKRDATKYRDTFRTLLLHAQQTAPPHEADIIVQALTQ